MAELDDSFEIKTDWKKQNLETTAMKQLEGKGTCIRATWKEWVSFLLNTINSSCLKVKCPEYITGSICNYRKHW